MIADYLPRGKQWASVGVAFALGAAAGVVLDHRLRPPVRVETTSTEKTYTESEYRQAVAATVQEWAERNTTRTEQKVKTTKIHREPSPAGKGCIVDTTITETTGSRVDSQARTGATENTSTVAESKGSAATERVASSVTAPADPSWRLALGAGYRLLDLKARPDVEAEAALRLLGPVWIYGRATTREASLSTRPDFVAGLRLEVSR